MVVLYSDTNLKVGILTRGSGASVQDQAQGTNSTDTSINSIYIPHVSNLIHPIRDALGLSDMRIPPVYLEAEAVDSSILLGHGASFTASLLKVLLPELLMASICYCLSRRKTMLFWKAT